LLSFFSCACTAIFKDKDMAKQMIKDFFM